MPVQVLQIRLIDDDRRRRTGAVGQDEIGGQMRPVRQRDEHVERFGDLVFGSTPAPVHKRAT